MSPSIFIHSRSFAVIVAVGIVLGLARLTLKKLRIGLPASALSWQSYLRDQGTLLFAFLLLGSGLGWLSIHFGGPPIDTTDGLKLVEYRQISIGEHPVYEDLNLDGYRHISVYARALEPAGSRIVVSVIPDATRPGHARIAVFESADSSWSRFDESVNAMHLTIIVANTETGVKASQADLLVFLGGKAKASAEKGKTQ